MAQQFVGIQQKDDAIVYEATLKDDAGAPITAGVTIDVDKPDGTNQVTGAAATHQGSGLWRYIVAKTAVDQYGIWVGTWHWTVDGTARQHRHLGPRTRFA